MLSQSAMEYLMTYGWAILAIAIVMVSLYSLGIFSLGNLQPTATPGSCQVIRTTAQTSLAGQCNNLIPKYVGSFNGAHHSYVSVGNFSSTAAATMTVWIAPNGDYTYRQNVMCGGNSGGSDVSARYVLGVLNVGMCPDGSWYTIITSGGSEQKACSGQKYNSTNFPAGKWVMLSITYDGSNVVFYKNGVVINTLTQTVSGGNLTAQPYMIGRAGAYSGLYFNGSIADVQIYNASLDNTTVKALYKEGIGGAPIDVGHLVAWWPLNGNANDYSGNNNQGTPTNVIWNANWQNGYSLPSS